MLRAKSTQSILPIQPPPRYSLHSTLLLKSARHKCPMTRQLSIWGDSAGWRFATLLGIEALLAGVHVVLIDLYPHGMHDTHGLHDYVWERMMAGSFQPEANLPLTLVSYTAGQPVQAWIEPHVDAEATP